jgi:hypothetical protein
LIRQDFRAISRPSAQSMIFLLHRATFLSIKEKTRKSSETTTFVFLLSYLPARKDDVKIHTKQTSFRTICIFLSLSDWFMSHFPPVRQNQKQRKEMYTKVVMERGKGEGV